MVSSGIDQLLPQHELRREPREVTCRVHSTGSSQHSAVRQQIPQQETYTYSRPADHERQWRHTSPTHRPHSESLPLTYLSSH